MQVVGINNAVDVSAGYIHACAELADGTAKCWGNASYGKLGNGVTTSGTNYNTPVTVAVGGTAATGVTDISAGSHHTCMVQSGAAKCWCYNATYGAVGDGTTTDRANPVQVVGLTSGVVDVEAGVNNYPDSAGATRWINSSCAIKTDGTLWCWGYNGLGVLGDQTATTPRSSPVQAKVDSTNGVTFGLEDGLSDGFLTDVKSVAVGGAHTCAVAGPTNVVYCTGYNASWAVAGNGSSANRTMFVPVRNEDDSDVLQYVTSVSVNNHISYTFTGFTRLLPDGITGEALAMGENDYGQLGDNTNTGTTGVPVITIPP